MSQFDLQYCTGWIVLLTLEDSQSIRGSNVMEMKDKDKRREKTLYVHKREVNYYSRKVCTVWCVIVSKSGYKL